MGDLGQSADGVVIYFLGEPITRRALILGIGIGVASAVTGGGLSAVLSNPNNIVYDFASDLFGWDITNEFFYSNPNVPRISRDYEANGHLDGKVDERRWHDGIDIVNRIGYPVIAAADATVIMSGPHPQRGERVILYHGKNKEKSPENKGGKFIQEVVSNQHIFSGYFNMDKRLVETGQEVKRGEKLGTIGNTGLSRKPHLHFMSWYSFTDKYDIEDDGLIRHHWDLVSPHLLWIRGKIIEPKELWQIKIPIYAKGTEYPSTPIAFTYPVPSR